MAAAVEAVVDDQRVGLLVLGERSDRAGELLLLGGWPGVDVDVSDPRAGQQSPRDIFAAEVVRLPDADVHLLTTPAVPERTGHQARGHVERLTVPFRDV